MLLYDLPILVSEEPEEFEESEESERFFPFRLLQIDTKIPLGIKGSLTIWAVSSGIKSDILLFFFFRLCYLRLYLLHQLLRCFRHITLILFGDQWPIMEMRRHHLLSNIEYLINPPLILPPYFWLHFFEDFLSYYFSHLRFDPLLHFLLYFESLLLICHLKVEVRWLMDLLWFVVLTAWNFGRLFGVWWFIRSCANHIFLVDVRSFLRNVFWHDR